MLDYLLEFHADELTDTAERGRLHECLAAERGRLLDAEHLQRSVIDYPAAFAWDFSCLETGLLELVGPYLQLHSQTGQLFLAALREWDALKPRYLPAVLLLEYSHYSTLINDGYSLHPEFTRREPDARACARLTQLKYAGQYVHIYPRYLLKNNVFGVSAEKLIELHQWVYGCYVARSIGRGVFLKWSEEFFRNVNYEHCAQNAINTLTIYIAFPLLLAARFAGISEPEQTCLMRACGRLALFAKLRCERNNWQRASELNGDERRRASALLLNFPGLLSARFGAQVDLPLSATQRAPDVYALRDAFVAKLGELDREALLRFCAAEEQRHWEAFEAELRGAPALPRTLAALRRCFGFE